MQDETLSTQRKAYVPGKCLSCYTMCPLTDHYRNGGGIGLIMLMLQNPDNLKLRCIRITAEKIDCLDTSYGNFHLCISKREFCEKLKSRESVAVMNMQQNNRRKSITSDYIRRSNILLTNRVRGYFKFRTTFSFP